MNGLKCFGYRIPTRQLLGGLVFWFIIGTVLWSTRDMPLFEDGAPGPRLVPVVLSVLFAVLSVCYWIEAATREPVEERPPSGEDRNLKRPAAFFGIAVLLALCWNSLGAVLTVLLCSLVELRFIERFSWRRSIVTAFVVSVVALVLFQIVLGVALPGGVLKSLSYIRL